jgi:hypothetical protein
MRVGDKASDLTTNGGSLHSTFHDPVALLPVKESPVSTEQETRFDLDHFGRGGEDKIVALQGIEPLPSSQ